MAFVDRSLELGEEWTDFPYIYNVTFAVGYGKVNALDDVMLVQYFLKKIWEKISASKPRPSGNLVVDGLMGPITHRWIKNFQSGGTLKEADHNWMVQDGVVDRAVGDAVVSGRRIWTILNLNLNFKIKYPELYPILPVAPDLPPLLAASLALSVGA